MKILHTSDWHLGRAFGSVSLDDDQRAFADWLVAFVAERKVELVVIAGDVYDRAVAPNTAIQLFKQTVVRLRAAGALVAAITGNHDGADRVASYGGMLDASGTYIRGGYESLGEVIRLQFADGPLDLVPLPYLHPQDAPDSLPAHEADTAGPAAGDAPASPAEAAYQRRLRRTHASVLSAAIAAAKPNQTSPRSLAIAHAFVGGATTSDSERALSIGGADQVPADLFDGFSYTALGHLHRPQNVGGRVNLRYSGTPLAYSFSEEHDKSVTLLEMAPDGSLTCIEEVTVPVGRPVYSPPPARIDDLLAATPTDKQRNSFVRAVITDSSVVLDAKRRLSVLYPHVVEVKLDPRNADGTPVVASGAPENRGHLQPEELADRFWQDSTKRPLTETERQLLHAALDAAARNIAGKEA